ncbi:MAG TPA: hypothetical protein DIW53_05855 [Achromobacter sp.]|nr:hypothetical protein [Achromobacter sp.]
MQGHFQVHAGERIEGKTVTLELQAAQSVVIKGPGGTITINGSGITLEALAINLKGPVAQAGGGGNSLSMAGDVVEGLLDDCMERAR